MLTDNQVQELIRVNLHDLVNDLVPDVDLASTVDHRYHARRRNQSAFSVGVVAAAAAALTGFLVTSHTPPPPTMELAGYSVTLPSGSMAEPPTSVCTQVAVQLNIPTGGATPAATSRDSITSPSGTGCISGLLTWVYGTGTAPTPDAIAPAAAQPTTIGPYPALEMTYSNGFTYYVQLPAAGGGYQDLVVGSIDLPQQEVASLVQQAIADHMRSITRG